MQTVAIVVDQAEDGGYSAHVPDLPTIVVAGETLDEVLRLAAEAVTIYMDEQAAAGLDAPDSFAVAYNLSLRPDAA